MTAFQLTPFAPQSGFVPYWPTTCSPVPCFSERGLTLGHGTVLVRVATGLSGAAAEAASLRAASLYAIAAGVPLSKAARAGLQAAITHWTSGDKALAQLRLVFADLPRLDSPADAERLAEAADLLDRGVSPASLMKRFGLEPYDDFAKFDPAQPRVPAGSGRESGRWTDGAASPAASPSAPSLFVEASGKPAAVDARASAPAPDETAPGPSLVPARAGGVAAPSAADPKTQGNSTQDASTQDAWQRFKDSFSAWLKEEVPVTDQDTGLQYGTQTRAQALLTNPFVVGTLATVGLLGGEAVLGTAGAGAAGGVEEGSSAFAALTREQLLARIKEMMPPGMKGGELGDLAGFQNSLEASKAASRIASDEAIKRLKAAGISRELLEAWAFHYAREAIRVPGQESALHRAALLRDILRRMK